MKKLLFISLAVLLMEIAMNSTVVGQKKDELRDIARLLPTSTKLANYIPKDIKDMSSEERKNWMFLNRTLLKQEFIECANAHNYKLNKKYSVVFMFGSLKNVKAEDKYENIFYGYFFHQLIIAVHTDYYPQVRYFLLSTMNEFVPSADEKLDDLEAVSGQPENNEAD